MHLFLFDPTIQPDDQADQNLKHRALRDFELINEGLYRKADKTYKTSCYFVSKNEGFDKVVQEHYRLDHPGRDKTWLAVDSRYYGINKLEVGWICAYCKFCKLNRPSAVKALLKPIIVNRTFERLQIDLINMRHEPSSTYA
jgi:hypothetical protein